jgi:O-antigen polymerase
LLQNIQDRKINICNHKLNSRSSVSFVLQALPVWVPINIGKIQVAEKKKSFGGMDGPKRGVVRLEKGFALFADNLTLLYPFALYPTTFTSRPLFLYYLPVTAMAALLAGFAVTGPGLFNGVVTGKQMGIECAALFAAFCSMPLLGYSTQFRITPTDAAVALFACWVAVRLLLVADGHRQGWEGPLFHCLLWSFIYCFVRLSMPVRPFASAAVGLWLLSALVVSVWGLCQLYGFLPSQHSMFLTTGPFHNPGPFAGYAAASLPLALAVRFATDKPFWPVVAYRKVPFFRWDIPWPVSAGGYGHVLLKCLSFGVLISVLLVVPAARSRAAWLAAIIGTGYTAWAHPAVAKYRLKAWGFVNRWTLPVRAVALLGVVALVVTLCYGLYAYKAGSANGRQLMWQVTGTLMAQKPLAGHGADAFGAMYMPAQAEWFRSGKGTAAQAMVAGSPEAPFNELLKLWLHYGLVAVAIAGGILFLIFKSPKQEAPSTTLPDGHHFLRRGLKGSLLALLVFGMFSYPFDLAPHTLLLVVAVALLAGSGKAVARINNPPMAAGVKTIVCALIIATAIVFVPQRTAYHRALAVWYQAEQIYNMRHYPGAVELYAQAMPALANNGLFLQMYGKALSMAGQREKSNGVLEKAHDKYSSYIIYTTMGDNHKALGNAAEAEKAYQTAAAMVPGMILPKYLLAKLYHDTGQQAKAVGTAKKVLSMPIKVHSMATDEIFNEMKKIITTNKQ